jgi:hypothetical protein
MKGWVKTCRVRGEGKMKREKEKGTGRYTHCLECLLRSLASGEYGQCSWRSVSYTSIDARLRSRINMYHDLQHRSSNAYSSSFALAALFFLSCSSSLLFGFSFCFRYSLTNLTIVSLSIPP